MSAEETSWSGVIALGILIGMAVRILANEIIAGFQAPIPRRVDQVDVLKWDVIAEARRILDGEPVVDGELVDGDDGATG